MYDIIIIGAGPAGLTAAIYARRALKKVLVLEKKNYGGQIINTLDIENYPTEAHISGFDFATKLYNQAKDLGTEVIFEQVTAIKNKRKLKEVITKNNIYKTKTIIIATGNESRKINIDNEDKFIGKGISYCATCDGNFYKNQDVAVYGGGNTAIEDAIYLSDIAKSVTIIYRKSNLKAEATLVKKLQEKTNVNFAYNSVITNINGNNKLESIDIINTDNKKTNIKITGLFIAIGRIPESSIFKDLIKLDDTGYIIAKENCHTNIKGIFTAGDIRSKQLRQLVTATSDGAIAATEAINYLNTN